MGGVGGSPEGVKRASKYVSPGLLLVIAAVAASCGGGGGGGTMSGGGGGATGTLEVLQMGTVVATGGTSPTGAYAILGLAPGGYEVRASFVDASSATQSSSAIPVTVAAGTTTTQDVPIP